MRSSHVTGNRGRECYKLVSGDNDGRVRGRLCKLSKDLPLVSSAHSLGFCDGFEAGFCARFGVHQSPPENVLLRGLTTSRGVHI